MVILICFASCSNSSSDSGDSQGKQYDINYDLGTQPDESLSFEKLGLDVSAKDNSEGIYLEFDVPKDTSQTRVSVQGLGTIAEEVQPLDESGKKSCFFYPFVAAGKEYTIRIVFLGDENEDKEGFVLNGDNVLGWFETKVTAGANSKGEVRFTSKGKISVDKKGNFKFTERPTFQNEQLLDNKWMVEIGLVEGVSWAHGDERKTKWYGSVQIPQADLLKQINLFNSFKEQNEWDIPGIDFICVRPIMQYTHEGKTYKYQWDSFVEDIFYPSKADRVQTIDINNSSDVAKIRGTWTQKGEYNETEHYQSPVHVVWNNTLVINGTTVKENYSSKYTKLDGTAFTKEEICNSWCSYDFTNESPKDELTDKYFHYEKVDADMMGNYKIYTLYPGITISEDYKTVIEKYDEDPSSLSEYFADYTDTHEDYTRTAHHELQVFEDKDLGSELRVIVSGKEDGEDYEWTIVYKKQ